MRKPLPRRPRITPSLVLSMLALFVALGGTSLASTEGALILGQTNDATTKTTLTAPIGGPAMQAVQHEGEGWGDCAGPERRGRPPAVHDHLVWTRPQPER